MIVIVAGIVCCFVLSPLLGLPLIGCGVVVVISLSGVEFDKDEKRMRQFTSFYLFKTGSWDVYMQEPGVTLDLYTSKSSTRVIAGAQTNWYGKAPVKTYLVQILNSSLEVIEVKEIPDYKTAREFATKLAVQLEMPFTDNAKALFDKAAQNRKDRDPRSNRKK